VVRFSYYDNWCWRHYDSRGSSVKIELKPAAT
jgi:hypothetical protein